MIEMTYQGVNIPEGYIIATIGHYPEGKSPMGGTLGYEFSVQLLNQTNGDMPRGTGNTCQEALDIAISRARPDQTLEQHMAELGEVMKMLASGKSFRIV